jgi:hypothetical protein
MIIIQYQDHGCVYTLDPYTQELFYAPICNDNTVNLSEFAPVDLHLVDDEYGIIMIRKKLINLNKR